jgi:hypothetical protein
MDMRIEQALLGRKTANHSPGFREDWLKEAHRLQAAFGFPADATFAGPLARNVVGIFRVRSTNAHVLAVPAPLYKALEGDLFAIAAAFPADWEAGEFGTLEWTKGVLPPRTVARLENILNTTPDRSAALLGAAQALLDGGRVVFERPGPEDNIVADLWALLPSAARAEMWPATYATSNEPGFHVLTTPKAEGEQYAGYLKEAEVAEYPEGRYERGLQEAVEAGDQPEVDRLLSRRSRSEMLRLAVILLVLVSLAAVFARVPLFGPKAEPDAPAVKKEKAEKKE